MATRKGKSLRDIIEQKLRISALARELDNTQAYNRYFRAAEISNQYRANILGTRSQKNLLKKTKYPVEQHYGTVALEGFDKKYTGYQNASTTRALSNG